MESEKVKEIKKALECCANWNGQSSCNDCPIGIEKCYEDENLMPRLALTLINKLESENKRLREGNYQVEQDFRKAEKQIAELEKENAKYKQKLTTNQWVQEIRKEALKQFSERLKEKAIRRQEFIGELAIDDIEYVKTKDIDETLKEFEYGQGKSQKN